MMDGNKLEELRELVEFLKANGIAEFDMEQDDLKVRIKFAGEPAAAVAGAPPHARVRRCPGRLRGRPRRRAVTAVHDIVHALGY